MQLHRSIGAMTAWIFSFGLTVVSCGAENWPVLRTYDRGHVERPLMPIGGIGTVTINLGGRGNLCDWEIMNRPAKGFTPYTGLHLGPFFASP